jgi:arylsulfatase A-like enzyme
MQDVLLITIDSLRADHVRSFGYERETTPEIDTLAADGNAFENTFAHACGTRPSFPSILSSSHALMHGGFERMTEGRTMIAQVFDDEGYGTAGFHSNVYLSSDFGYDMGFDVFYDSRTAASSTARVRRFVRNRLNEEGILYSMLSSLFDTAERHAGLNIGSIYDTAEEITDQALEYARSTDASDPQFMWVHYMDVHHPYVPPAEHQGAFRADPIGEQRAIKLRRKMIESPEEVTEDELSNIIDLFDAEIRYADAEIGRLVENVRGAWGEDTIVAVTADHGEEFLDHGQFSHPSTFYDEVIHVPLVLTGGPGNGEHDELVGLQDVAPTIVDLAGVDVPEEFNGYSLRPLLEGDGEWPRTHVIGDHTDRDGEFRYAYRDHEWKFIQINDREQLYHLPEDPDERRNVLEDHPEVAAEFRDLLDEHKERTDATTGDLVAAEMDEDVRERLRDLGYQE